MTTRYDCLVVGAGHNGLTIACLLAKQGRRVLVVERQAYTGGLAGGYEFRPGYQTPGMLHDSSQVRLRVSEKLKLSEYGLQHDARPPSVFIPGDGRSGLMLHHDPAEALPAFKAAGLSESDQAAYKKFREFIDRIRPFMETIIDGAPQDPYVRSVSGFVKLMKAGLGLRLLGRKDMLELMRIAPMCVGDWLDEWFTDDRLKAGLAGPALWGNYGGPWSPSTNLNFLIYQCMSQGEVIGGGQALARALTSCARDHGVEILTDLEVTRINVEEQKVTGAQLSDGSLISCGLVAASCDPKVLFRELICPEQLPFRLSSRIGDLRSRGTTGKIHYALRAPLKFESGQDLVHTHIRTAQTLNDIERAFDAIKYRAMPDRPALDIFQASVQAPELAPAGHAVLSVMVNFVPHALKGGWDERARASLAARVEAEIELHSSGFSAQIVGREVLTPVDLSRIYSLPEGNIFHGEHAPDQLIQRPTPETANYKTPIRGLILCGSGSYPGGGLTCAPGYGAAFAVD